MSRHCDLAVHCKASWWGKATLLQAAHFSALCRLVVQLALAYGLLVNHVCGLLQFCCAACLSIVALYFLNRCRLQLQRQALKVHV